MIGHLYLFEPDSNAAEVSGHPEVIVNTPIRGK